MHSWTELSWTAGSASSCPSYAHHLWTQVYDNHHLCRKWALEAQISIPLPNRMFYIWVDPWAVNGLCEILAAFLNFTKATSWNLCDAPDNKAQTYAKMQHTVSATASRISHPWETKMWYHTASYNPVCVCKSGPPWLPPQWKLSTISFLVSTL